MQTLTEKLYKDSIADFKKEFSYKNAMAVPRLKMVSLNVGIKAADSDNKFLPYLATQVSNIAGQKAVLTKSKKAISTYKLRENLPIGCRVTLRGKRMYQFLDRLVNIALPRIRDFPEVNLDNVMKVFGMNINIVTTAKTKEEALFLLKKINFPIK